MDQIPLVTELVDAGKRFVEEFDKTFPIAVAFWLKDRDESSWNLHIASRQINDADRQKAFGEIVRVTTQMKDPYVGLMDIRLQKMDDRIVQFALDIQRRRPGLTMVFDVPSYYGVEVEGMYLYPPLQTAAA